MKKRTTVTYERIEHTGHESAQWARDTNQPADEHDPATKRDHERAAEHTRQLHSQGFTAHVSRRR